MKFLICFSVICNSLNLLLAVELIFVAKTCLRSWAHQPNDASQKPYFEHTCRNPRQRSRSKRDPDHPLPTSPPSVLMKQEYQLWILCSVITMTSASFPTPILRNQKKNTGGTRLSGVCGVWGVCGGHFGLIFFWLKPKKLRRFSLFEIELKLAYWNFDWMAFWLKPKA